MASTYPASMDTFSTPGANLSTAPGHATMHTQLSDALTAVESVLGVNPQSGSASVAARLAALTTTANTANGNAAAAVADIAAINAELGNNPSAGSATVSARLDALALADIPWTATNAVVTSNGNTSGIASTIWHRILAGRICEWTCVTFFSGAVTAGGTIVISCPVSPMSNGVNCGQVVGTALLLNSGIGRRAANVYSIPGGGGAFQIDVAAGGYQSVASATVPWPWKANDEMVASGSFRYA